MIILPTYGQPHRCQEVLDAVALTGSLPGIVIVDGGDVSGYRDLRLPEGWTVQINYDNVGVVATLNKAFETFPSEDCYIFLSQDTVPVTVGWDKALKAAAGSWGIASCDDGWQAPRRAHGAVALGGGMVRAWGFIAPSCLIHSFCDDFWETVGKRTGNWRVLMDVLVEHRHAGNGKADQADHWVYQKAYETLEADRAAWEGEKETFLAATCALVRHFWRGKWFLPSYKRPELCQQALDSFVEKGMTTQGVLIVNGADPKYDDIRLPEGWEKITIPKNEGVVKAMNFAFAKYPDLDWYGCVTDDLVAKTDHWDAEVLSVLSRTGIASCLDNFRAPARIGGAVAFGGDLLRNWGFWFIPELYHGHADEFWEVCGIEWRNWQTCHTATVEHLSPLGGKRPADAVHNEVYARVAQDRVVFDEWMAREKASVYDRMAVLMPWAPVKVKQTDLSGLSIAIGTPAYGDQFTGTYLNSLLGSIQSLINNGVPFQTIFRPNDSMIDRARNIIVRQFLFETECTHLLFIDADMGWEPDAPLRLLSHGYDVVAAVGMRKQDGEPSWCWLPKEGGQTDPETGCVPALSVGTGFMMISRRLLQLMWDTSPELAFNFADGKEYRGLFQSVIFNFSNWSEDYQFCLRAAKCGIQVMADPAVTLSHVGNKAWTGSILSHQQRRT
jgi:hypothetical protein